MDLSFEQLRSVQPHELRFPWRSIQALADRERADEQAEIGDRDILLGIFAFDLTELRGRGLEIEAEREERNDQHPEEPLVSPRFDQPCSCQHYGPLERKKPHPVRPRCGDGFCAELCPTRRPI